MVQKSLVDYIKNMQRQGYDVNSIRNTLSRAGYSRYDIEDGIKAAQKKPINKTLLMIFFSILGLILIVVILLVLIRPEPAELSLDTSTYSTRVAPGQQLTINANINNPTKKQTKAIIDVRISGPRPIQVPSQSIQVKERASIPIQATIPQDAPEGQYMAYVTIAYEGKQKTETESFEVRKAEAQAPSTIDRLREEQRTQEECPGGCDDFDPCTRDRCENGVCIHTRIKPCCGNGECEEGETAISCPEDCATEQIEEATRLARERPQQALQKCEEAPSRDTCIKEVADAAGDKGLCERISKTAIKDGCLMQFAYKGDYSVCGQIQDKLTKNSCFTLKNLAKYQ